MTGRIKVITHRPKRMHHLPLVFEARRTGNCTCCNRRLGPRQTKHGDTICGPCVKTCVPPALKYTFGSAADPSFLTTPALPPPAPCLVCNEPALPDTCLCGDRTCQYLDRNWDNILAERLTQSPSPDREVPDHPFEPGLAPAFASMDRATVETCVTPGPSTPVHGNSPTPALTPSPHMSPGLPGSAQ